MNDQIQPEELTELLDDDLEMWAQGGTRILPKSPLAPAPKPDSYPPVAYPSMPPSSIAPATPGRATHAPVWAALFGMAAVFFLAAVGGGIFYAIHRASNEREARAAATAAVVDTATAVATTSEPEQVAVTATSEPVEIIAPTATAVATSAPKTNTVVAAAPPPPQVRYGAIQTFAAGAGKPVFLDGKQIGTGGAHLKAACGKHSVSVGSGRAKTYDIPCSGSAITVGTPDGT